MSESCAVRMGLVVTFPDCKSKFGLAVDEKLQGIVDGRAFLKLDPLHYNIQQIFGTDKKKGGAPTNGLRS